LPSFKELQLGRLGFEGYDCASGSQKLFAFVAMKLARVDASFCTCFGLAEPLVGSGTSGGMTTTAKREGDTWVLNGQKRWIGKRRSLEAATRYRTRHRLYAVSTTAIRPGIGIG
jgi:glutaryl-CoA dehydrogenase